MKYVLLIISIGTLSGQVLDERYHTTDEIYNLLDSLNQLEELNSWFHLDTIGYSTQENIPILAVKISDNANIKEDEPRVLFVGQVHAEEVLGIEVVLELLNDLLFPDASIYTHMNILKEYLEIWIVPTGNPDGLNVVHEGLDLSYRKNKRDLSPEGLLPNGIFDYDPVIGNDVDGVDLNRNFDFNWVFGDTFLEPDNSDYSAHFDYYKGEVPFSENEAIALRDLALEHDFIFSIVWHSSRSGNLSEKVFTSWQWEGTKDSPDLNIMKSVADYFAGLMNTEDGIGTYLSVYSESRNGKLHDWFYRETGCFQYLVECGTANLQPDSILIEDTIDRTKPAMVYLMDRAIGYYTDASQVTGIVYDAFTNQPIEGAIVEVLEHTGSVLKPRLTDEFGRYRRIMNPGTYTISIRAAEYLPQEITAVANNSGITTEDIFLEPAENHTLTLTLVHHTLDIITIDGFIQNEFDMETIQISTGENSFELSEGEYTIVFHLDNEFIPWEKDISLTGDYSCIVPYLHGNRIMLSESWPWENGAGPWTAENAVLRSQGNLYYNNSDSTLSSNWMESDLIDISGTNRVVVSVIHQFETEWDNDPIRIEILDENNYALGSKIWTGDRWDELQTHLITATTETEFSKVKIRLDFSPDQTVNYRGWRLHEVSLYSIIDDYLDLVELAGFKTPQFPMIINGLYPNPSNGRFQIDLSNYPGGKGTIRVFNLLGQELLSHALINLSSGRRHILDLNLNLLSNRPVGSGMVFIRVETEKEQVVKKCVLLKN